MLLLSDRESNERPRCDHSRQLKQETLTSPGSAPTWDEAHDIFWEEWLHRHQSAAFLHVYLRVSAPPSQGRTELSMMGLKQVLAGQGKLEVLGEVPAQPYIHCGIRLDQLHRQSANVTVGGIKFP